MKGRTLFIMAVLAVAALSAAYFWGALRAPVTSVASEGGALFPGLDERINDISRIKVSRADGAGLTLVRGEQYWQVEQKGGYPADTGEVRKLLVMLSESTLKERKTADPARYEALGLGNDGGDDGAVSLQLEPSEGIGHDATVLVGASARGLTGTYIRRPDDPQAWLASGDFSPSTEPMSWIDQQILDLATNRVQRVVITHPDGDVVNISKAARSGINYFVADLPADAELKYASVANPIGAALSTLRMEDAVPAAQLAVPDDAVHAVYSTFDGIVITARAFEHDGAYYAAFSSSFDESLGQQFASDPVERELAGSADTPSEPASDAEAADLSAFADESEALDAKLSPWVFALGSYKHEQMTRRMGDLLKEDSPPSE